jgi:hypothetical protein
MGNHLWPYFLRNVVTKIDSNASKIDSNASTLDSIASKLILDLKLKPRREG